MEFRSKLIEIGYIDALGNSFDLKGTELESCFSFKEYKTVADSMEFDAAEELNSNDTNMDVVDSSLNKSVKRKRGCYKYYSQAQKQRFWNMIIEEGNSTYRSGLLNDINLQTAYTWKRNWDQQVVEEINGIY
ncbi:uncharacterized protein SPAPADRAFT_52860 [Spathaspora passalidarum NRRL Y-27907]|uniref:Uncharacterized protein n=1 Tax=Spathaspora passalidarum (strain NRRL Y-27907 / 11-Y1) TaxID=619300 RepID=G3AVX1_SPAPN|nr:uncharacterized protein SPAPADRAFT_52860 [Spathaspora passalidarum NRRL Y-27907]EGW30016.1 hypothetical protein SPAPADRAFT_52860 [Spathaspora passalidarum NRRL Y-27907]